MKSVIVQSILSMKNVSVCVLFDAVASHSFICNELVYRLGLEPKIYDRPFVVTNPVGVCPVCV